MSIMLRRTFYCAENNCTSAEAFTIQVDPLAAAHDDDTTMRLMATSCGWHIDHLEDEAWCPAHRAGDMSGI